MHPNVQEILFDEATVQKRVGELAQQIAEDYRHSDKKLVLLCILKGSVVFMGDLMKKIPIPVEIDFMRVSSYGQGSKSSGTIRIQLDLIRGDIADCDILIVEDIVDSGRTCSYLTNYLLLKGAHSVRTVTLLDKPARREVDFKADYTGFEIPDAFIVGYGLDYQERYRDLPYIGILKPSVYAEKGES